MTTTPLVRRTLTGSLVGWGLTSVAAGAALERAGRRRGDECWAGCGRQTWFWGAIDVGIAVVGHLRSRAEASKSSAGSAQVLPAERATLSKVLAINAVLDVGYVAGGVARAGRLGPPVLGAGTPRAVGEGVAIVVQGAALFALDALSWWRLRRVPPGR